MDFAYYIYCSASHYIHIMSHQTKFHENPFIIDEPGISDFFGRGGRFGGSREKLRISRKTVVGNDIIGNLSKFHQNRSIFSGRKIGAFKSGDIRTN